MSSKNARVSAVIDSVQRQPRVVEWPKQGSRPAYVSELFGEHVFSLQRLQKTLPKPVYNIFIQQLKVRGFFWLIS